MDHGSRPKGRTFSFNLSFGKKPPVDEAKPQELLERDRADAADSSGGTGMATDTRTFKVDFADGKLRIGGADSDSPPYEDPSAPQPDPAAARDAQMWDTLHRIADGKGAYPDTARWHARLSMLVWVIAIALPVAALVLALATGQDQQTVVVMTFGAAILAAMLRSSVR